MRLIYRESLEKLHLTGRVLQKAVGIEGYATSKKMTMGFAVYSAESGPMEPHHHAEEIVYIISAKNGWLRSGRDKDQLGERVRLESGMTVHFDELEWHVFEYDNEGHVDIIFFYGQVYNIRPEELLKQDQ